MKSLAKRNQSTDIAKSLQLGDFVRWSVFIDTASRTTYFGSAVKLRAYTQLEEWYRFGIVSCVNNSEGGALTRDIYSLDLKYDLLFHSSSVDEWYQVREPEPYEIEYAQKVSKEEALAHLKGKIDSLQKIVEEATRNPKIIYRVVNDGEYFCPIVIHEDKQEEALRLIACIYARRKFRLEEMHDILKKAKTPRNRIKIREMRKRPNTNFFVVAQEHETFEAMLAPVAVYLINPEQIEMDELRAGYIFAAMYPEFFGKKFDEVPPNYVAFEVPQEALDLGLVTEVIRLYIPPPNLKKVSFRKIDNPRRMLNQ